MKMIAMVTGHFGRKTLRTRTRHFGTGAEVSQDSGHLTHKVVTRPAISLAQDRESLPAGTGVLTTMLRNQLGLVPPYVRF